MSQDEDESRLGDLESDESLGGGKQIGAGDSRRGPLFIKRIYKPIVTRKQGASYRRHA